MMPAGPLRPLIWFSSPSIPHCFPTVLARLSLPSQRGGRGVAMCCPAPAPLAGFWDTTQRHGRYLEEPRLGEASSLPRWLSAFALRAARKGGARPRPGLPRPLRRGYCHQLFARLLLQVGPGLWTGGTCAGPGQSLQSIQQHIWLHLLHSTAVVRLPPGSLGICPAGAELPGVSRWFCLPGLDPLLCAL